MLGGGPAGDPKTSRAAELCTRGPGVPARLTISGAKNAMKISATMNASAAIATLSRRRRRQNSCRGERAMSPPGATTIWGCRFLSEQVRSARADLGRLPTARCCCVQCCPSRAEPRMRDRRVDPQSVWETYYGERRNLLLRHPPAGGGVPSPPSALGACGRTSICIRWISRRSPARACAWASSPSPHGLGLENVALRGRVTRRAGGRPRRATPGSRRARGPCPPGLRERARGARWR